MGGKRKVDTMPWKLKIDEETKQPVFEDEKPIYINDEGKELALDPPGMYQKIIDLGKEAKNHREKAKAFQSQLAVFEGIDDLETWKDEAIKALETVKNFNDKDWMKAEKVERLKADMKEAHEKQVQQLNEQFGMKEKDYQQTLSKKDDQIRRLMVSAKFASHPLFSGKDPKTTLPPEIAETYFGKHFKVEETDDGSLRLNAYYSNGDPVYSQINPGDLAEFEEAMNIIFEKYPAKDSLMRAGDPGSGSQGGSGAGGDDGDELAKLEKAYAAAIENKQSQKAIMLKNQIFKLKQEKMRGSRAA